jgi:hypothetical protein
MPIGFNSSSGINNLNKITGIGIPYNTNAYTTNTNGLAKAPITRTSVQVQNNPISNMNNYNNVPNNNNQNFGFNSGYYSTPYGGGQLYSGSGTGISNYSNISQNKVNNSPIGSFNNSYNNTPTNTPKNTGNDPYLDANGNYREPTLGELYNESKNAVEEAKQKQEASKTAALGYYDQFSNMLPEYQNQMNNNYQQSLGYYQPIANQLNNMQGDLISPEEMQRMAANRKDTLSANGQNLASAFGDSDSGIQSGRRLGIAMNTAELGANIPLQTELDVNQANRSANMDLLGQRANIAGAMANLGQQNQLNQANMLGYYGNIASGKAGIQQNYQYDPGLDYITKLSQALGNKSNGATIYGGKTKAGGEGGTSTGPKNYMIPGLGQKIPTVDDYSYFPDSYDNSDLAGGYNPYGSEEQANEVDAGYDLSGMYDTSQWQ